MSDTVVGVENVACDNEAALEFARVWFGETDKIINLVRMNAYGEKKNLKPLGLTSANLIKMLGSADISQLVYAEGVCSNLYHSVAFMSKMPDGLRRGSRRDVDSVPGLWCDLDCKPESFRDAEHALSFLRELPLLPTIVVSTGSGGMHAYFKLNTPLGGDEIQTLGNKWHAYLVKRAGVAVDRLNDPVRVLRTPGSVRFGKTLEESAAPVKLLYSSGPSYDPQDFEALSKDCWEEVVTRQRETRQRIARSSLSSSYVAEGLTGFPRLVASVHMVDDFAEQITWEEILTRFGWKHFSGPDYRGRIQWQRPGGEGKAAVSDFEDSPHVLSLFSDSASTGLADLKDAGIVLTKYRVWVALEWGGDEAGFVGSYLGGNGIYAA